MHHIRDHDFDRRLSELDAHSRKIPRLALPSAAPTSQPAKDPMKSSPSGKKSKTLQPAPELKPASRTTSNPSGLSSPPLSAGDCGDEGTKTPMQGVRRQLASPLQLSSPPATVLRDAGDKLPTGEEGGSTPGQGFLHATDAYLMPSHKDDAVDGLLKLMAVDNPETAEECTGW